MKHFIFLAGLFQVIAAVALAADYVPYQPSSPICVQNPYLSNCNGTKEQCEANPYLSQCEGTRAQCEANPYLSQCNGTPAQCDKNPHLPQCQNPVQPVNPAIDKLCRDNGYTR